MSLQVETGNFTRIVNEVLEQLVKVDLLAAEYKIILFVIRKTWGFQKTEDIISLTQFEEFTGLSRPTIIKTIKNLVKRGLLVKRSLLGNQQIAYKFNKYWDSWLVNTTLLVKNNAPTSKKRLDLLVKRGLHTKEIQKKTKEKDFKISEEDIDDPVTRQKAEEIKQRIREQQGWSK
jgi:phage replication O-like protein O